jgi:glycosyltransferase involved in cell wall biosynthesis
LKVALDYTPAISQTAGVGRYTRSLVAAMQQIASTDDIDWHLWYAAEVDADVRLPEHPRTSASRLPVSSRWLNLAWHRLGIPISIDRWIDRPDVAHGTDFVVPPSSCPSVVTIHDLSYAITPQFAFPRLKKYLDRAVPRSIDRARRVIAVSETTKRDLCELYEISPNRVEVIHHAADPLFSKPSESAIFAMQAQLGLRRPYFITVGTVEPRKDHSTLIKAFRKVHEERPDVSLVIVGKTGWLAEDIVQEIGSASENMPVRHLHGISDDLLPALYAGSLALVYPSQYEGFGLPLLEAMASGTAVIASSNPAHTEVAGNAALFASVGNADEMAARMMKVASDQDERQRLIEAGTARNAQFTWESAAERHISVYREVAG